MLNPSRDESEDGHGSVYAVEWGACHVIPDQRHENGKELEKKA